MEHFSGTYPNSDISLIKKEMGLFVTQAQRNGVTCSEQISFPIYSFAEKKLKRNEINSKASNLIVN